MTGKCMLLNNKKYVVTWSYYEERKPYVTYCRPLKESSGKKSENMNISDILNRKNIQDGYQHPIYTRI